MVFITFFKMQVKIGFLVGKQLLANSLYHHCRLQEIRVDNKGLRPSGLVKHLQLLGEQAELRGKKESM
jgi:hypothetical protein